MVYPPLISVVDDSDSVRESLTGLIRSAGFAAEDFPSAEKFPEFGALVRYALFDTRRAYARHGWAGTST